MNRPVTLGVVVFVLLGYGVVMAQSPARAQESEPPQQRELYPTHPPEPIAPVPPNAHSNDADIAINSTLWTSFGPAPIINGQRPGSGPVSGRLTGIAADPGNANTIYVTAAGGGIWKTTNGGSTWTSLAFGLPQTMGAIAIAPSNANVIYAGQGEANNSGDSNYGRGILVSTDAGSNWTTYTAGGAFDRKAVSEIAVDPTNPSVAYAAVADAVNGLGGNTGIWKTTNTGATWTNTTTAITTLVAFSSVRIDPNNPATLYAAVGGFGTVQNGVYKTIDGGANWNLLGGAPRGTGYARIVVAVAKTNSQVVYVAATSDATFGLQTFARSDDGGATFTDLTAGTPNYLGGQGWYDTTLIVDPLNSAIVYAGGASGSNSLIRSINSGLTWTDISLTGSGSTGPHVDHHAAAFDASGRYLDGDDGGIYRLDSVSPVQWTHLNGNLNTIQFQGIAIHPTNLNIAFGGSQDNGTSRYTGSSSWQLVEGGDGGFVRFSKTNPIRIYHQAPVASFGSAAFFRRSDDGGTSWVSKVSGITDNSGSLQNFYAPFVVDPGNGDRVLYGARHVFETTNGGDGWSALGAAFSSNVTAIGLAPSDVNAMYAAAATQTYFSSDHGTTWNLRNLPVSGVVRDIQVSPSNPLIAYAVIGQFTSGGNVFKTTNGGVLWTNISGNLPSLPAWSLQIDSTTAGQLFVGNDDGAYVTTDDGGSWSRFGFLPNAQVFQIELNTTLGVVAAGTHGRGLWVISLSQLPPPATTLLSPSGAIGANPPTYTWTNLISATWYYLWVANSSGTPVFQQWYTAAQVGCGPSTFGVSNCAVTPPVPLTNGTYWWSVETWNPAGYGPWSRALSFVPGFAGTSLIAPSGTVGTTTPTYTWNNVRAPWYYLWVQTSTGVPVLQTWYSAASACPASGGTCSVTPSFAVTAGVGYSWYVETYYDVGSYGPWAGPLDFRTDVPPATSLIFPFGSIGTQTPTYTWNIVSSSSWYYLWVQNQAGTPVIQTWYTAASVCGTRSCSVTPAVTLAASDTHTWRVETWDGIGYGPWSPIRTFTPMAPTATTLTSPAGGVPTTQPTYIWNKVSSSTWYYLWVQNAGGTPVIQTWYTSDSVCGGGSGVCSVTPPVDLVSGNTHTWYIQTWNPMAYGPWSTGFTFTPTATLPVAATLSSPLNTAVETSPGVTFQWNKVAAATYYFLWVDNVSTGNVIQQWYTGSSVCGSALCSVPTPLNLPSGQYNWWIRTWSPGGYGPWSTGFTFTVASAPTSIVLTWKERPGQLDAHLLTPQIGAFYYHVFYANKGSTTLPPYAHHEFDRFSFGNENIIIAVPFAGTYRYFVDNFFGSENGERPLAGSGATVKIYRNDTLLTTLTAPASGTGDFWQVCDINGATGALVSCPNTIGDSEPTFADGRPIDAADEKLKPTEGERATADKPAATENP